MTTKRTVGLMLAILLAVAAGVAVGFFWGVVNATRVATGTRDFRDGLYASEVGVHALALYFDSDPQAAEESPQEYLALQEELHTHRPPAADPGYSFDTTCTLVRLGNVRLRSNDPVGAQQFFARATLRCARGQDDCSESHLRELVDRIDRASPVSVIAHSTATPVPASS